MSLTRARHEETGQATQLIVTTPEPPRCRSCVSLKLQRRPCHSHATMKVSKVLQGLKTWEFSTVIDEPRLLMGDWNVYTMANRMKVRSSVSTFLRFLQVLTDAKMS